MIETQQALDNLDEILSVKGLDAVYIGPADLSMSLGCTPTFDDVDPPDAVASRDRVERFDHGQRRQLHAVDRHRHAVLERDLHLFELVGLDDGDNEFHRCVSFRARSVGAARYAVYV